MKFGITFKYMLRLVFDKLFHCIDNVHDVLKVTQST